MKTLRKWSLIGLPDHQGVIHVGGRLGAAHGPAAFRRKFFTLKGRLPIIDACRDAGDLTPIDSDVLVNHQRAIDLISKSHPTDGVSVVVGGGHDHGHTHLVGVRNAFGAKRLGCINIDAHLDVRKPEGPITSGSPFYLSLDQKILTGDRFVEFGIQSHCNPPVLWDFVENHGVTVVSFDLLRRGGAVERFTSELQQLHQKCDAIVISLDLDALASSYAPGVSAPQSEGFSSREVIDMLRIAGANERVVSLGIFELNPTHDIDDRTSLLAAKCAWEFVSSTANRN